MPKATDPAGEADDLVYYILDSTSGLHYGPVAKPARQHLFKILRKGQMMSNLSLYLNGSWQRSNR